MSTNSEWVLGPHGPKQQTPYPLLGTAGLRILEAQAASELPAQSLMQRAGLALAQLTLAYAPHAQQVWVACGSGNNGGDGMEAALHLQQWGKTVWLSLPASDQPLPSDAMAALQRAQVAGVMIRTTLPTQWEVCIDALLGIGLRAAPKGAVLTAIHTMQTGGADIIAADIPSGLLADTGQAPGACVRARATLSFLSLKPGLFTALGRDVCGDIWLNTLGTPPSPEPNAWLNTIGPGNPRQHDSHKGSYGDVAVVGGATGMVGAALLAGSAALHGGTGRVYLALLDSGNQTPIFATHPALMQSTVEQLALDRMTAVAGCGGGDAIATHMPRLMRSARQLVLDADALNSLAHHPQWLTMLASRKAGTTLLTPHPLEAARLLDCSTAEVQADRMASARALAQIFQCTVVLKGSGTVIAHPNEAPHINPTGNARLATAGTGDVLAGLVGSLMAQGHHSFEAACSACYRHGQVADQWDDTSMLTAPDLARRI